MSLSWYRASLAERTPTAALNTRLEADVVVVGAGLAGLSAALELAQRGHQVVVLEADEVGSGASGVNGGQVLTGLACDWAVLADLVGLERCRQVWALSHEAVRLVQERAASAADQCHWRSGALSVTTSKAKAQKLERSLLAMERALGPQCQWLDAAATRQQVASTLYHGAISDGLSGHIHPLAYTRHVAQLAQSAGAQLYESSPVLRLEQSASGVSAHTAHGRVSARFGVIAANINCWRLEQQLRGRVLAVGTYLIATEPLPPSLAQALMPQAPAVCDTNHVLDYFRLSHDHRLLFGGRVSYTGWASPGLYRRLQRRMERVFPQLKGVGISHCWGGKVDISLNRAPDFGRHNRLYYLQGFSGHGLALTGLAGRLVAEAISDQPERWLALADIPHRRFPASGLSAQLLTALGMLYYRARDVV